MYKLNFINIFHSQKHEGHIRSKLKSKGDLNSHNNINQSVKLLFIIIFISYQKNNTI